VGEVVNLRRARKARDRLARAEEASRNRAASGRTAVERAGAAEERARRDAALDRHRIEVPGDGPTG
jgi:hypothetical protein